MSAITTHVLDTAAGRPARDLHVALERRDAQDRWHVVGQGVTDGDGRLRTLLSPDAELAAGIYRLTFDTGGYFAARRLVSFYPQVSIIFEVRDPAEHYHVPLLLSPYGYSTYRGS